MRTLTSRHVYDLMSHNRKINVQQADKPNWPRFLHETRADIGTPESVTGGASRLPAFVSWL